MVNIVGLNKAEVVLYDSKEDFEKIKNSNSIVRFLPKEDAFKFYFQLMMESGLLEDVAVENRG